MTDKMRKAIITHLKENGEEALDIARQLNSQDGSFDWVEAYDFDELCTWAAEGGADSVAELVRACVYGDTWGGRVRYNGYGNLESAEEDILISDAQSYVGDIVNALDDYIDEDGNISTLDVSIELEDICHEAGIINLLITNIDYDIDKEDLEGYNSVDEYLEEYNLKTELEISAASSEIMGWTQESGDIIDEDLLTDLISDTTGYCVNGYNYEVI